MINIELTKEEGIVLLEFLTRFNEIERSNLIEDQAEQRVLWDVECILEKQLIGPLTSNYQEILQNAREQVRDKE